MTGEERDRANSLVQAANDHPSPQNSLQAALALDAVGREKTAIQFYEQALAGELSRDERRVAGICLASSLRNVGKLDEAKQVIEKTRRSNRRDPVVDAFYSLILLDCGEPDRAVAVLGHAFVASAAPGALEGFDDALSSKFRGLSRRGGRDGA